MHSPLFYVLAITASVIGVGSIITVVAMMNAPEGYEGDDGFIGLTKGDERLLNEFAAFRQQALAHAGASSM